MSNRHQLGLITAALLLGDMFTVPTGPRKRTIYRSPQETKELNKLRKEKKRKRKISAKSKKQNRKRAA